MFLWTPTPDAPVRGDMVFSLFKRPVSWKRPIPTSAGGKFFMRKNNDDREHQGEILRAFTRKATQLKMLELFPWDGPMAVCIHNYFNKPKNWFSGKEKDGTPDADNLAKQVLDSLQPRGAGGWGAFHNDSQVISILSSKSYDGRGDIITVQLILFEKVTKPIKVRGKPRG